MDKLFKIVLNSEYDKVNLYSFTFEGESLSEFEKFLESWKYDDSVKKDFQTIIYWLNKITESGALERYFRPEGKYKDEIKAIPIEFGKLRLYCLRVSDEMLIVGGGGRKTTRTYNEDPFLEQCVANLSIISATIRNKLKTGTLKIRGKELIGIEEIAFQKKSDEKK